MFQRLVGILLSVKASVILKEFIRSERVIIQVIASVICHRPLINCSIERIIIYYCIQHTFHNFQSRRRLVVLVVKIKINKDHQEHSRTLKNIEC